jgi:hypothetical protein
MMFAQHHCTPIECLVIGTVLFLICGLEFVVVLFQPRRWTRWRWGEGDGPRVSRVGGAAWGIFFGIFGAVAILNGYLAVLPSSRVLPILFAAFGLVCIAGFYDTFLDWRRRRRRRGGGRHK